jgi:cohesin domain-containing protein/purple acid phosphatase-like protein
MRKPNKQETRSINKIRVLFLAALIYAVSCLMGFPARALGASPSVKIGSVSGGAGSAVDLPVTFTPGDTDVSTLQFDLSLPASLSYVSVATGSVATTAGKSASANTISGGVRVLVFGLNQTPIGSGSIVTIRLSIAGNTVPGILAVGIAGTVASDPDGNAVATTGIDGSVTASTPSDTTTLVISSVKASSITSSNVTISWTTNKASDSQVEYGASPMYGNLTSLSATLATSHSLTVSGLQASTIYHYRVKSRDAGSNLATSSDSSFTTGAAASEISFSQIILSNVGNSSVTIDWTTNRATTGLVQYGLSASLDNVASDSLTVTRHATVLNGLIPSTIYHYRVTATDGSNNTVTSSILMFKTSDQLNQPAKPSAGAIFMPSVAENSRFRTNLGINNLSSSIASVTITLVDKQGMVLASKTLSVEPKGLKQINSVAHFLSEGSLGDDIQGSLYLESDQPVRAWASQIENTTNDPSLLLSKPAGTTKILIPSAANISTFSSSLVVMNLGTVPTQVALKAYSVNGSEVGQTATPLSIPLSGVLSFENILQTLGVTNNYGPIEITSLNGVPLIASSRVSSASKTGGFFEGLKYSEASVTQIVPNVVDNAQLRTNIGINNVSDQAATVMVRLINQDGVELGATPVMVAPKGLTQINNVARQLLSQTGISNFEGYIRLESNQPIFGWASIIDNVTNDPGFAVSRGTGSTRLLVESTTNMGSFRSSLVVINTSDVEAIVDIVSRDTTGNINGELRGLVIPARGYFSNPNVLQQLGVSNNFGPLEILSTNGQSILATSRVYSTSGTSGFFEGESIE